MSKFSDQEGSTLTQNSKKKALQIVINQLNKSKQSYSHIFIQHPNPQGCMEEQNSSQYQYARLKQNRNILNNSLLQDIGNIDLEIQKMNDDTSVNQTQIMNSNNKLLNLNVIVCQLNQVDVSKSEFKISLINKIKNFKDNYYKSNVANQIAEGSYQKLAQSMRNNSNQKNMVEVKIRQILKSKPNNILSTKKYSDINNSQNMIKTPKPQVNRQSLKINSERNKFVLIKPILKQTSFNSQDFRCIQTNLIPNVSKKLDDVHKEIKNIINDNNKLQQAVKIYNTLKQLVQQHPIFQSKMNDQKEYKNRITQ